MKTCGIVLFMIVLAVSADEPSDEPADGDPMEDINEVPISLDNIFDKLLTYIDDYVDDEPHGKSLARFFKKMRKEVRNDSSFQSIKAAFDGKDNLFTLIWNLMMAAVKVEYEASPMASLFIRKFLNDVKSTITVPDILHLVTGFQSELMDKVKSAAAKAAKEIGQSSRLAPVIDSFIRNIDNGLVNEE